MNYPCGKKDTQCLYIAGESLKRTGEDGKLRLGLGGLHHRSIYFARDWPDTKKFQLEENFQMQKKIIALAIAAAFSAPAFADVTVYGVVDAAIVNVSGSGQKSDLLTYSGGLAGSRLGVKSVQDAGDMKVVAVAEYSLDTQVADGIGAARQEMLALAGGFGTVATGYLQTTGYDWAKLYDPTAGSLVSPLQNVTNGSVALIGTKALASRAPRALAYISPDLGGVTVAVNYTSSFDNALGNLTVPSAAVTGLKTTAYLLSATYTGGPLSVGGVYAKTANASTGYNSVSEMALGASYDLTVVKLFGTYQSLKVAGTDGTEKAMSIGAVAPVGPGAILASYAKNNMTLGGATNASASGLTVGYLQGLSKTTTVYAAYTKMSQNSGTRAYSVVNDALSAASLELGGGSQMLAVGLNNKF
jgi:hypothetical protein